MMQGIGTTGSIRLVKVKGFKKWSERLNFIDHNKRIVKYSLLEGHPFPFRNHQGSINVKKLGANNSNIIWTAEFEVDESKVHQSKELLRLIIDEAIKRIRDLLES